MSTSTYVLYVGSYAASDQPGIQVWTFNEATGALARQGAVSSVANPSFVLPHPNGRLVYAVSETHRKQDGTPGMVCALRCTETLGNIVPINARESGGDWPCHLSLDVTGRWLLVANYASGTLGVLPTLSDGALGEMTDLIQHSGLGVHPERQAGPHVHSTIFTPDHRFVIVADLGIDRLVVYAFDPAVGRLHAHTHTSTRPGAGPRHLAFHPSGQSLYVASELDNTVGVYYYDAASGKLRELQIIETLPPNAPESAVADIHLSSAGDRVYVSNRGDDSITIFAVEADQRLTRLGSWPCGGRWPRHFTITPNGRFLLVANQKSDEVVVLPLQREPEALEAPSTRVAVPGASCVQFGLQS